MLNCQKAYVNKRAELALQCSNALGNLTQKNTALEAVFWENAWAAEDGIPQYLFYEPKKLARRNVLVFAEEKALAIDKIANFSRLQVTTNWVLKLQDFVDFDAWFSSLSKKNKKKLRWMRNAIPRENAEIIAINDSATFKQFLSLYEKQFPAEAKKRNNSKALELIYLELMKQGKNFSWMLLDDKKEPVAANLGFINENTFSFTHLTRNFGKMAKFSPAFYLTYWLIEKIFTEKPELQYFFMGPGEYDYKPSFLAKALPVYRYEYNSILNFPALLRMKNRLRQERLGNRD